MCVYLHPLHGAEMGGGLGVAQKDESDLDGWSKHEAGLMRAEWWVRLLMIGGSKATAIGHGAGGARCGLGRALKCESTLTLRIYHGVKRGNEVVLHMP